MLHRSATMIGALPFLLAVLPLSTAAADEGPYVSLFVGGAETDDVEADDVDVEFDTGFAFAGQFGYNFNNFRLGGELGYQFADGESSNDVSSEVDVTRFTLNGYVDLPLAPGAVPYVGGGFGVANLSTGDDFNDDFEDEDTAFTWHGEAGVKLALTPQFALAPTYRYQWIDTDIGGQTDPLVSHIFGLSLHYQFYPRAYVSPRSKPPRRRYGHYDSGYSSYGAGYYRDDRHDHYRHRHSQGGRERSAEELERNRCGWQGPGCNDGLTVN